MQGVIVYDVVPGGRVIVYETVYSDADAFDAWLQCLNDKGKATNPRFIERPGSHVLPGTPGKTPQKP